MPDPADKSDDLIAELAKLMASAPGGSSGGVQPLAKPAPLNSAPAPQPAQAAPQPASFRIPGMETPITPRSTAPAPQPQPEPRGPSTGSIRIPGMDQPAPVSTSAPVGKFDFGGKPAITPIKQEPLSSFTDRLQAGRNLANDTAPRADVPPAPIRIPSDLKPVSENKSFGEGPSLSVGRPAAPAPFVPQPAPAPVAPPSAPDSSSSDFHFDFGLSANPQPAAAVEPPRQAAPPAPEPEDDPIAALIAADMAEGGETEADEEIEAAYEPAPEPARPAAVVTPMIRAVGPQGPKVTTMAPANQAPQRQQGNMPIPLKPVSVAPRSADNDRFAISPGVGLNMKPPASQKLSPQPRAPEPVSEYDASDPMSEIESLIGEAVRVELTPGPVRVQTPQQVAPKVQLERGADLEREIRQQPAPVVPPLTTSFAPRRANLKDEAANASAEDAILAAAAASGAEVGRIEPQVGDESPYRRLKVKPQRSSFLSGGMRQYVGMAVAGTLLLAAGLGLYWVLNMGRTSNATAANTAPQLTADATPIKVKPAATPTPATDSAKSPVLAKMDGTSSTPSQEQLVSTDETNGGTVTRDVTPTTTTADNSDESGLANRKVRTVTVRPDGTIVSGDSALAGGEALPIDRPNVPAVPSTETTNLLGNADTQVTAADPALTNAPAADATAQVAEAQPVIDPNAVAPTPMNFPVRNSSAPLALTTPPKNTKVNAVTANTDAGTTDLLGQSQDPQVAAVTPPKKTVLAAPAPVSSGNSGNAAAYVQLSSQPTQADAQASIKAMTAKYGSLFGGNSLTVQQVDLGQKGVKWRVRLPAASFNDASSICSQIKAQGGDCFPTKG